LSPLTAAEVDQYLANVAPDSEGVEFLDRMRNLGADDGEEIFMLNLNRYEYADDESKVGVPAAYIKRLRKPGIFPSRLQR